MRSGSKLAAASAVLVLSAIMAGCTGAETVPTPQAAENRSTCGGGECHGEVVERQGTAAHAGLLCVDCHEGTGEEHAADPKTALAPIDWRIDACAECHESEAVTYLYDDNAQVGPFGGSQRTPPQPKADTFPEYGTIAAGHAFTKDYNEEGAHTYLLEDHYEITRGKFETCVQCKSTKVAAAWDTGKPIVVAEDTEIELTHTRAPGVDAKKVMIPKGTKVTLGTDPATRRTDATAVFPDGTRWSSQPAPSEDATQNYNMMWASTIATTKETFPYGAGCNHCHDPHTGGYRLVRKAMLGAIEGEGGPEGTGGVNPYQKNSPKDWTKASAKDRRILMCAQCHVEYTCGKSGVDGVNRDAYGWAKATDLHELYSTQFDYTQDWKNALMGEPLIKSQHPETELYWESVHYNAGAACSDCHMPEVRDMNNRTFRSHWFTSPYKYSDQTTWASFAASTGVDPQSQGNPCRICHDDRTARGIELQQRFYERQAQIETLLARSVREFEKLKQAKAAKKAIDEQAYGEALEAHQRAHVIWENLAVSENSMGFHNFAESMASMDEAEKQILTALEAEKRALAGK